MNKKLILTLDNMEDVPLKIIKESETHIFATFVHKYSIRIPKSALFCYENDINYYASPFSIEPYTLQKLKFS